MLCSCTNKQNKQNKLVHEKTVETLETLLSGWGNIFSIRRKEQGP